MKKSISKLIVLLITMLIMLPAFSSVVHAKSYLTINGFPVTGIIPLLVAVVVLVVIKAIKKNGSIGGGSDSSSFMGPGSMNSDPTLTPEENQLLMMYTAEMKAKKPDPVSTTCPNCGAPLKISDIAVCPYCRTELANNNIDPKFLKEKKKVIPPEQYNPRRYYEENNTGYDNIKNQPDINSYYGEEKSGFSPYSSGSGYNSSGSSYGSNNSSYGNGYGSSYGNNSSFGNGSSYGSNSSFGNDYGNSYGSNGSFGNDSSYGSNGSFGNDYGSSSGTDSGSGFATGNGFNDNNNW